ncbi:histidine phosphatase family protein [Methyloversatilis thermotolerans]|uniref:histidine phosphatase family protein n=1 Tax=Methyloversatilis thermotolerans TaxID=1346290 RepID=UPI00036CD33F|nr:histidine phosphatase family protein [Methyloversatilis thermotolerans]
MIAQTVWLYRHPPVRVSAGVCYGRSDVPLADPDAAPCPRLRSGLPARVRVISSPLSRCLHVARQLAPSALSDARLQEMDFGRWEMRSYDEIDRAAIDEWARSPWDFVPPEGESGKAMAQRTWEAWLEHETSASALLIVSHGGPLRVLAGRLLGTPQTEWLDRPFPPGGWMCLERDENGWREQCASWEPEAGKE